MKKNVVSILHRFNSYAASKRPLVLLCSAAVLTISVAVCLVILNHGAQGRHGHEGGLLVQDSALHTKPLLRDSTFTVLSQAQTVSQVCTGNTSGKLVLVSLAQQHLWACDGSQLVNQSPVTTGASAVTNVDDATPTGTWHIYGKQTNLHLRGSDANGSWDDAVQYWLPFYSDYGFHDAAWQTIPFGSAAYTTEGSHGCVHLPTDFIAWLYNWAPIGTTVTVTA